MKATAVLFVMFIFWVILLIKFFYGLFFDEKVLDWPTTIAPRGEVIVLHVITLILLGLSMIFPASLIPKKKD